MITVRAVLVQYPGSIEKTKFNALHIFLRRFSRSFTFLQMQKTRKSIAKRFKLTGGGKLMRRTPGRRHMLRNKSVKQKRSSKKDKSVSPGFTKNFLSMLPHL